MFSYNFLFSFPWPLAENSVSLDLKYSHMNDDFLARDIIPNTADMLSSHFKGNPLHISLIKILLNSVCDHYVKFKISWKTFLYYIYLITIVLRMLFILFFLYIICQVIIPPCYFLFICLRYIFIKLHR